MSKDRRLGRGLAAVLGSSFDEADSGAAPERQRDCGRENAETPHEGHEEHQEDERLRHATDVEPQPEDETQHQQQEAHPQGDEDQVEEDRADLDRLR